MLWSFLFIAAGSYLGLACLILVFQSGLIYYPARDIEAAPKQLGMSYEEVWLETSDNLRLHSWFIPAKESRGVIIFCHGNAGNISHRLDSILIFHRLGWSVLIFDYRGYGLSDGKPSEQGTYRDAEAAWIYLTEERRIPRNKIVIFGRSLGGAIAAWLAQGRSPKGLILESSFTSVPDMGARLFPYLPIKLMSRFNYNTLEYLKKSESPVLIAHSPEDELIPFDYGEILFESAREPKSFLRMRGGHNEGFILSGRSYVIGLDAFLNGTGKVSGQGRASANQKNNFIR